MSDHKSNESPKRKVKMADSEDAEDPIQCKYSN